MKSYRQWALTAFAFPACPAYAWVYNQFHLWDLDPFDGRMWVLSFLAVDLAYYFFHRCVPRISMVQ